ncbi:MAG: imidazole glycerol phosphate synthase subunit HisF, partial [Spirochaeta sp.]|nr:imidazole glycerol phosphate synthase subunit HisF [Spirochaeta sp.]
AVRNPAIIEEGASLFGSQCIVLGLDAAKDERMSSGYRVFINGGRTPTELDALEWALRAEKLGAGEIVVNAMDADGTKAGYELELTRLISKSVGVPVVASGGAGNPEHLYEVFANGAADAALIASIVHLGSYSIYSLKEYLQQRNIPVRL